MLRGRKNLQPEESWRGKCPTGYNNCISQQTGNNIDIMYFCTKRLLLQVYYIIIYDSR